MRKLHRIQARNWITVTLGAMAFGEAFIFKGTPHLIPSFIPIIIGGIIILALFNATFESAPASETEGFRVLESGIGDQGPAPGNWEETENIKSKSH